MVHIQVHGAASFCRRVHGAVNITDRSDDELVHVAVIHIEVLQIVHNSLIDLDRFLKIRVTIRNKIPFTDAVKIAHAPVCSAFYADILPQVVIA